MMITPDRLSTAHNSSWYGCGLAAAAASRPGNTKQNGLGAWLEAADFGPALSTNKAAKVVTGMTAIVA